MPTLGAALDFAKLEARNIRAHQLGTAPAAPVTGQFYFNTGDNTLYWWDGTNWVSARGGVASLPDASTTTKGIVQLAGDLTGTAASPQIAAGVITDAEIAAANKDGANATPSLRTLGYSAGKAMPGNATLDVISLPTAPVSFNNQRLSNVPTPSNPSDAANKTYVDNVAQGLNAKQSVRLAGVGNFPLTGNLPLIVDGFGIGVSYDQSRILLLSQTNSPDNGIYLFRTFGGATYTLSRTADADTWSDLVSAYVWVEEGTQNKETGFLCTADQGGTLGTTPVPWVTFANTTGVTAGPGHVVAGFNYIEGGAGAGIQVNAHSVQVAPNGIDNSMIADGAINLGTADVTGTLPITKGGTLATTPATARSNLFAAGHYTSAVHAAGTTISVPAATHGLRGSMGLIVQVQDATTGNVELPDVAVNSSGDVTISFGASVTANSKRITIVG
jgi:hypothetical protein